MEPSKNFVRMVIVACSLAIAQGFVWIILCLLGIMAYFGVWDPTAYEVSYSYILGHVLIAIFYVQVTKMLVMLILFLFLSIIWIGVSISLLINIRKTQNIKTRSNLMTWSAWTIWICVYDVIAVGILVSDYDDIVNDPFNTNPNNVIPFTYMPVAFGILFSIAARGYVLWCVNLTFAIIVVRHTRKLKQNGADNYNNSNNAYAGERRRSFESNGNVNAGFDWRGNNRPPPHQTNSYAGSSERGYIRPQPYLNASPQPNYNDNIAGIGRQHPNAFPHKILSPKPPSNYMYSKPVYS